MMLKRHYHSETLNREGVAQRVCHFEVIHTGLQAEQNFDGFIDAGVAEGWATMEGDRLSLKTDGEPLRYTVTRVPGYFCKSTGEAIPITAKAWAKFRYGGDSTESRPQALAWLASNGKNAGDYDIAVAYHCVLDADQHERFHAVRDIAGNVVAAHTQEA